MKNKEIEAAAMDMIRSLLKTDIPRLLPVQQTVLTEIFCNGKTFTELKDLVNLSTSRQKSILDNAVKIVIAHIETTNEKLSSYRKMEIELSELRHWKELLEANLVKKAEKEIDPELKKKLSQPVQLVEFSTRVKQVLANEKIKTVGDLINYPRHELLKFRNFGKGSIIEIEAYFVKHGLWWDMVI